MIEKNKTNNSGECRIYTEVSISKKDEKKRIVRIPTNYKVTPTDWSSKSQSLIKGKSEDYYKINKALFSRREEIYKIIAELEEKGSFTLEEIKQKAIKLHEPVRDTFFDLYGKFLLVKKESLTFNGIKDFNTLRSHLEKFELYRKNKITLSSIDSKFLEDFENYLYKYKPKPKGKKEKQEGLSDGTVIKNITTLRTFLNYHTERDYPTNLAYKKFKIKRKPDPQVITINQDEFNKLLVPVNNPKYEKVRKLFVFLCSTGLRYSDGIKVRKHHIGDNQIKITTTKTRQKLSIPLNEISKNILKEVDYDTSKIAISNQKFNYYIKDLCNDVGIRDMVVKTIFRGNKEIEKPKEKWEILSSHHGRKFFITQMLINGIRPEVIMSMTGHVDFRSFKKYIDVTDKAKQSAMETWNKTFK